MFSTFPMIHFFPHEVGHQNTPFICSLSGPSVIFYNPFWPTSQQFAHQRSLRSQVSKLARANIAKFANLPICVFRRSQRMVGRTVSGTCWCVRSALSRDNFYNVYFLLYVCLMHRQKQLCFFSLRPCTSTGLQNCGRRLWQFLIYGFVLS